MPHLVEPPPFPNDVSTAQLPRLSYAKLLSMTESETDLLFSILKVTGLFLLDLRDTSEGAELLNDVADIFNVSEKLFGLEDEEKLKYVLDWKTTNGYKAAGMGKTDSQGTPDRCEFYTVGRDDILGVTSQRDAPPVLNGSRDVFKSFMLHSHGVVEHLYTYLEFHLQLPPGTFSSKNRISFPSGTQTRLLKFSPQPSDDRRTSMVPHTDLGTITILFNILGGLQFLSPGLENSEKNWQFVRPEPGCAIINLGDAMVKWTNGLFKSPYHRVTYAPGEQANRVRYSVAYLVRPENETPMKRLQGSEMIPPLKEGEVEEDITAAEWHHKQSEKHRAK